MESVYNQSAKQLYLLVYLFRASQRLFWVFTLKRVRNFHTDIFYADVVVGQDRLWTSMRRSVSVSSHVLQFRSVNIRLQVDVSGAASPRCLHGGDAAAASQFFR